MTEASKLLIKHLLGLSKIDSSLARLLAERRKLNDEKKKRDQDLASDKKIYDDRQKFLAELKAKYNREEKSLKEEREKLVDRRKALTSLGSFKLQQAAEREIDGAALRLNVHEEEVLKIMEEVETLEKEVATLLEKVQNREKELATFHENSKETLASLDQREKEGQNQRQEIATQVDPEQLKRYDAVRQRFPTDPMVLVDKTQCLCGGCNMKVGPQILIQLFKQENLVKCPGCARLLYLEVSEEQSA